MDDNYYLSSIQIKLFGRGRQSDYSHLSCSRCPNLTFVDFSSCAGYTIYYVEETPLRFSSLATNSSGLFSGSWGPVKYPGKTINSIGDTCLSSFRMEANAIPKNPSVFKVVKDNVEYFGKADDGNICTFGAGEYYAENY